MLGTWKSVDFVKNVDDFNPEELSGTGPLHIKEISILEEGRLTREYWSQRKSTAHLSWTDDLIINHNESTASKCIIKIIEGDTYMFYEWKSGDYIFRGKQPSYYVLKKVK